MSTHFNTPAGFAISQTRELEKNVTFSEGWYSVWVKVDFLHKQGESNETNNAMTASVYCQ
jgi:subtilase family serine protease